MQRLAGSDHVVKLLDFLEDDDDSYFIVMEELRGRDLLYSTSVTSGNEPLTKKYMFDVVRGVLHMHERGYAHRDLSLENIMLRARTQGNDPDASGFFIDPPIE